MTVRRVGSFILICLCSALVLSVTLTASEGFSDLVQLAEAGASSTEVISYIQTSPYRHNLSDAEHEVLLDLGYDDSVFNAAHEKATHLTGPTYESEDTVEEFTYPAAPPSDNAPLDTSYFYTSLAPYGKWVEDNGDWFWRPTVALVQPHWRPYCDEGHWVQSESGWTWASNYGWGWAPFHYGRWTRHPGYGWLWHPDAVWGPAWVSWRQNEEAMGWAPLPPSVGWNNNAVAYTDNRPEWGLASSDFIFVSFKDLSEERWWEHRYKRDDKLRIYSTSRPIENHLVFEHDRIINRGPQPELVLKFGGHAIPQVSIALSSKPVSRITGVIRDVVSIFRPSIQSHSVKVSPRDIQAIEDQNRQKVMLEREARLQNRHFDNIQVAQEDRALKERLAAVETRRDAQVHQASARSYHLQAEEADAERKRIDALKKDRIEANERAKAEAADAYHRNLRNESAQREKEAQDRAKQAEQAARDTEKQREAAQKEEERRADEAAKRDREQQAAEARRREQELANQRKNEADETRRRDLANQEAAARQQREALVRQQEEAKKAQEETKKAQEAAAHNRAVATKSAATEQAQRQSQLDTARKNALNNSVQRIQNAQHEEYSNEHKH